MASEQVNKILEAEKKASEIEQEARTKADNILVEAQKTAQKEYQDSLVLSRKKVLDLYDKHNSDNTDAEAAGNLADDEATREIKSQASKNREAAVKAAMDILLGR